MCIRDSNETYKGTPGLWELMTMKEPNESIYDDKDLNDYGEILHETNAMSQPNNPNRPKSSGSDKYKKIVKTIWEAKKGKPSTGEGVVVIPQDPNALVKMLSLRIASFQAGNTGVRNEIVGICDELLRQGTMNTERYKKLMLQL